MAVQPATRRMLTEQAGAVLFGGAVPKTALGVASTTGATPTTGVATLGTDGKVSAAQMPPVTGLPVVSYLNALFTITAAGSTLQDTGLEVALTPGLWQIQAAGVTQLGDTQQNVQVGLAAAGALVASAGSFITNWADTGSGGSGVSAALWTAGTGVTANTMLVGAGPTSGATQVPLRLVGHLRVTTAGTLRLRMQRSASAANSGLREGTTLTALRLGS